MITLYHGSNIAVPTPLAKIGRKNLDFGRGFYLTSIRKQAADWAGIIAMRKGREEKGVVSIYHFDKAKAIDMGVLVSFIEKTQPKMWQKYLNTTTTRSASAL